MRIASVRISGYRPIPFCADYDSDAPDIRWRGPFEVSFPVEFEPRVGGTFDWDEESVDLADSTGSELIGAFIGANSSGKSSVFDALQMFFSSQTKLSEDCYNGKDCTQPVIVEVDAIGRINDPQVFPCVGNARNQVADLTEWLDDNCSQLAIEGENDGRLYRLTVAAVWSSSPSRVNYIRKPNGMYARVGTQDKNVYQTLLPQYRLVPAVGRLDQELDPSKQTLMADLFRGLIESQKRKQRSLFSQIHGRLTDLSARLQRRRGMYGWSDIDGLERSLADGLVSINPNAQVRFDFTTALPTAEDVLRGCRLLIDDGVETGPDQHGLGMQRSIGLATLRVWCEMIGHEEGYQDYFFVVEEPEMYLHPHAIRLMLETLGRIARHDQVLFTTHTNEFANRVPLSNITLLRRSPAGSRCTQPDLSAIDKTQLTKIQRYLLEDRSDMLFARAVLLVEGQSELFALPAFARSLGLEIDKYGVSVVYTNGKGNFQIYHHILEAFGIPHVILGDGDGNRVGREQRYRQLVGQADRVQILDEDLEHLVAKTFPEDRVLEIINACRLYRDHDPVAVLPVPQIEPIHIKSEWWQSLKDDIHEFIPSEHRSTYDIRKQDLQALLLQLAEDVVLNGHLSPDTQLTRRARYLAKQGKPLVGRVVGELLNPDEVRQLTPVALVLEKAVELASA